MSMNTETRRDEEIRRAVTRALQANAEVPDERIQVSVAQGEVKLEGSVDWNHQRDLAEACVRSVRSVRGIDDRLAIQPAAAVAESW